VHYEHEYTFLKLNFVEPNLPPQCNWLLAALPRATFKRLLPNLECVALPLGRPIYEPGSRMDHVLFPTDGIVAMLSVMENGDSGEIAVIGLEGLVGICLFMGGESTSSRAVVQSAGHGYRLPAAALMQEFNRGGELQQLLLRFTQALIAQMTQTAACNRHHTVKQQLCRWLLLTLDRVPADEILMTQELLAHMQGVRRQGITSAAGDLQADGLIEYTRGRIAVVDRRRLESVACECYRAVLKESRRLIPNLRPTPSRAAHR
jgi:CRP-like cAMP-binding protein